MRVTRRKIWTIVIAMSVKTRAPVTSDAEFLRFFVDMQILTTTGTTHIWATEENRGGLERILYDTMNDMQRINVH